MEFDEDDNWMFEVDDEGREVEIVRGLDSARSRGRGRGSVRGRGSTRGRVYGRLQESGTSRGGKGDGLERGGSMSARGSGTGRGGQGSLLERGGGSTPNYRWG